MSKVFKDDDRDENGLCLTPHEWFCGGLCEYHGPGEQSLVQDDRKHNRLICNSKQTRLGQGAHRTVCGSPA